jgi:hypothetical protein
MNKEELEKQAEEYTNQQGMPEMNSKYVYEAIKQAYIKGYKDNKPKWVKCSNRLPETPGEYLTIHKMLGIRVFQFNVIDKCWFYSESGNNQITYWMPLPSIENINL